MICEEFGVLDLQAQVVAAIDILLINYPNDIFLFHKALFSSDFVVVVFILSILQLMICFAIAGFEFGLSSARFQIALLIYDINKLRARVKLHLHLLRRIAEFKLTKILHVVDVEEVQLGFFLCKSLTRVRNILSHQIDLKEFIWFQWCASL